MLELAQVARDTDEPVFDGCGYDVFLFVCVHAGVYRGKEDQTWRRYASSTFLLLSSSKGAHLSRKRSHVGFRV